MACGVLIIYSLRTCCAFNLNEILLGRSSVIKMSLWICDMWMSDIYKLLRFLKTGSKALLFKPKNYFQTDNIVPTSNKLLTPPTCKVLSHRSPLFLQTRMNAYEVALLLPSQQTIKFPWLEKCCGWGWGWLMKNPFQVVLWHGGHQRQSVLKKGNNVACCGMLTNKMKKRSACDASSFILWQLEVSG